MAGTSESDGALVGVESREVGASDYIRFFWGGDRRDWDFILRDKENHRGFLGR